MSRSWQSKGISMLSMSVMVRCIQFTDQTPSIHVYDPCQCPEFLDGLSLNIQKTERPLAQRIIVEFARQQRPRRSLGFGELQAHLGLGNE